MQKLFFLISPLFAVLAFRVIYQQPRSGSMRRKTNLTRPLKTLNYKLHPLDDLIISPHVKHPLKNLLKKLFCSLMQSFFMEKVPSYFVRGEETLCFIFKFIPIS